MHVNKIAIYYYISKKNIAYIFHFSKWRKREVSNATHSECQMFQVLWLKKKKLSKYFISMMFRTNANNAVWVKDNYNITRQHIQKMDYFIPHRFKYIQAERCDVRTVMASWISRKTLHEYRNMLWRLKFLRNWVALKHVWHTRKPNVKVHLKTEQQVPVLSTSFPNQRVLPSLSTNIDFSVKSLECISQTAVLIPAHMTADRSLIPARSISALPSFICTIFTKWHGLQLTINNSRWTLIR